VNHIGELRVTNHEFWAWCANTYGQEMIGAGLRLLCFANPGYVRAYCLDDQRLYHLSDSEFTQNATLYA